MKTNQSQRRRMFILLGLSLLLHGLALVLIDWRSLFSPEPAASQQAVTVKLKVTPLEKEAPKESASVAEPEAPPPPTPEQEVVKQAESAPEPEHAEEAAKAPESQMPAPVEEESAPVLLHTDSESGSSNQKDRQKGQVVLGAEERPADVPPLLSPEEKAQEAALAEQASSKPESQEVAQQARQAQESQAEQQAQQKQDQTSAREGEMRPRGEQKVLSTEGQGQSWKQVQSPVEGERALDRPPGWQGQSSEGRARQDRQAQQEQQWQQKMEQQRATELEQLLEAARAQESQAEQPEVLQPLGNMDLLSDEQLSEVGVEEPFSEKESEELRVVNLILERMNRQVYERWVNPYDGGKLYRGVIKVALSELGYIENVWIHRPSGLDALDQSVLKAIRAVPRFEVPENQIIAQRYYSNLSFHYSSIELKTELLPFEQEAQEKEKAAKSPTQTQEVP